MKPETIKKVIDEIKDHIKDNSMIAGNEFVRFPDSRYSSYIINKDNFKNLPDVNSNASITFIDGGNSEILRSPSVSVQFIRIYSTRYKDNKRVSSSREEFYCVVTAKEDSGSIRYNAKILPLDSPVSLSENLSFDYLDETLKEGKSKVKLSRIGDAIRRFAELSHAKTMISKMQSGDMIILDGTLQATITHESGYLKALHDAAKDKRVKVAGLSKTSDLLTNKGNPVGGILLSMNPLNSWYYHPVVDISNPDHEAELLFVKLNARSGYVFRFELFKGSDPSDILQVLSSNSTDPVFLGYPYGLIEADKFARVTNQEKEYIKTMFMVKSGEFWNDIKRLSSSTDAHDILDKIGF